MRKFILILLLLFATTFVFAEEKTFNLSEVAEESLTVSVNSSQKTLNKGIKVSSNGIQIYAERPHSYYGSHTLSIVFIDPLVIENAAEMKSAKIVGKSLGYNATVILHFVDSHGNTKRVIFKDAVPKLSGNYELVWDNASYIPDVKDRNPVLRPIWPFNTRDLYLTEIEFHLNSGQVDSYLVKFPYNVQEIDSFAVIYDKDTLEGKDLEQEFEETFGIEGKTNSCINVRAENLRAEKKEAEAREKALQATEDFYSNTQKD